jgi:hypothetical protein
VLLVSEADADELGLGVGEGSVASKQIVSTAASSVAEVASIKVLKM